ncbi:putative colanic acid biosynthesis acetyltransferase [Mesorhizobium sp. RMAD-H1]|uniref:putative colanic acid biosynthesis acetyltransferase n=1 Tax=Mesorhizobium sp. RMAD-H1 TaxID=2587065 RepID=UPI00160A7577|nr:putative colanic acid biosynthesis acetyltransferase [Mesorhizobium sp. RMAD-H1]MBB2969607.1 putative colanic acid biosynthesis acetyltransferase WcaF [Mesorhizobium sp. RMAD-H1]
MLSRYSDPHSLPSAAPTPLLGGPTFALRHRLMRLVWQAAWLAFAAWTPSFLWGWRGLLLRAFGAEIHPTAIVRGSARIWWPAHLSMGAHASLGPGAICYNVAPVRLDDFAIVSQRAHLCTGTHDINHPDFPLKARPISVGRHGWIAAEAFVGPGVTVGEGAVLGARGVAFRNLDAWTVYAGNPARAVNKRRSASSTSA